MSVSAAADERVGAASTHRHLLASSGAIVATTVLNSLLGFAFWTLLARTVPQGQVGMAGALIAAATGVALVTSQAQAAHLLAALPRADAAARLRLLNRGVGIAIGWGVGLVVALALPTLLASSVVTLPRLALLSVLAAATGVSTVLDAAAIGVRSADLVPGRNALFALAKLVAVLPLLGVGDSIRGRSGDLILTAWTGATALACVVGYLALRRRCHRHLVDAVEEVSAPSRREAAAQYLAAIGGGLPAQTLPVLVAALAGAESAARFNMAWLIGGACFMLSPALATGLLAEGAREPALMGAKTRLAAKLSAAALVPCAAGLTLLAAPILRLFGPQYADGTTVLLLALLAWSSLPDAITNLGVSVFRVHRRLGDAAAVNVVAAVVAIGGTWLLVPRTGIIGAGVAWLASQVIGSGVVFAVRRNRAVT